MKEALKALRRNAVARALISAALFYLVLPVTAFGMYQLTGEDGAPAEVPYILFVPYVLGVVAHWYKNWESEKIALSFFSYLKRNGFATLFSLVIGTGGLTALYAAEGHSGLYPVTITSWLNVFMFAVAADTINSGFTKSTPAAPTTAGK